MATAYEEALFDTLWDYAQRAGHADHLDQPKGPKPRPPVLKPEAATYNVIVAPQTSEEQRAAVVNAIPMHSRHRWYRSMASSQALAQSVFANLRVLDRLDILERVETDTGEPMIGFQPETAELEHEVAYLDELKRKTSIDVLIGGPDGRRVAIECKLREQEVGECSRPDLRERDKNFETDHCDGSYSVQRRRAERCSLTQAGIGYWKYIPQVFTWDAGRDWPECPMRRQYQLVRNVLAATVQPDRTVDTARGHAVLVYDERNPAFRLGGLGRTAFDVARGGLKQLGLLRKVSWQRIVTVMLRDAHLKGLALALREKYGFAPG